MYLMSAKQWMSSLATKAKEPFLEDQVHKMTMKDLILSETFLIESLVSQGLEMMPKPNKKNFLTNSVVKILRETNGYLKILTVKPL